MTIRYILQSIFQDSGRPPSWIFKVGNFKCRYVSEGKYVSSCQISLRSVKSLARYGFLWRRGVVIASLI